MDATKFTVTIKIEALSTDSLPSLMMEALTGIAQDKPQGELIHDDGDKVAWKTVAEPVRF